MFLMGEKKMFDLSQEAEEGTKVERKRISPCLALTLCPCSLHLIPSPHLKFSLMLESCFSASNAESSQNVKNSRSQKRWL